MPQDRRILTPVSTSQSFRARQEPSLDQAYIIQFAVSAIAIIVLASVAAWARIPRKVAPLDEAADWIAKQKTLWAWRLGELEKVLKDE